DEAGAPGDPPRRRALPPDPSGADLPAGCGARRRSSRRAGTAGPLPSGGKRGRGPAHRAPGEAVKLLLAALVVLSFPALVGTTTAAVATAPHEPPAPRLFAWVPEDGFPDAYPYGQCTWWAAYNRRVTWGGNARDWLVNAQAQGIATTEYPSVGAIAVYRPGGHYSSYGHVAI